MTDEIFTHLGVEYDTSFESENMRHGGPFDRGSADSYYRRGYDIHYYVGATGSTPRIEEADMTSDQVSQYLAGYAYNEKHGDHKEW